MGVQSQTSFRSMQLQKTEKRKVEFPYAPCYNKIIGRRMTHCYIFTDQNVVLSTTILTVPGNRLCFVKVSSISMASSSSSIVSSDAISSVSHSCKTHGGEPDERNIPDAAACVSIGELREAEGLLGPREFRAMRI